MVRPPEEWTLVSIGSVPAGEDHFEIILQPKRSELFTHTQRWKLILQEVISSVNTTASVQVYPHDSDSLFTADNYFWARSIGPNSSGGVATAGSVSGTSWPLPTYGNASYATPIEAILTINGGDNPSPQNSQLMIRRVGASSNIEHMYGRVFRQVRGVRVTTGSGTWVAGKYQLYKGISM